MYAYYYAFETYKHACTVPEAVLEGGSGAMATPDKVGPFLWPPRFILGFSWRHRGTLKTVTRMENDLSLSAEICWAKFVSPQCPPLDENV